MSFFQIEMFSTHSLAGTEFAEKVYGILDSWDFPPDVFDKYEPIRQPWEMREDFIKAWTQQGQRYFGQVLIRRRKRLAYYASVLFEFGENRKFDNKPPYHGISVYRVKESQCSQKTMEKLVELGDQLFHELQMDYGFVCLDEEYDAKNIIKNVLHPDGAVEPRKVIGMNWPQCIPGLYWINYFGRAYLENCFAEKALTDFSANIEKVGCGIRFQTSGDPRLFRSEEGAALERKMRDALGENWFFDRTTDRKCRSFVTSSEQLRFP